MTETGGQPPVSFPTKEVADGSVLPGHAGHGLVGFQLCGLCAVCGWCRGICEQRRNTSCSMRNLSL
ncbi:hypothetical protein [Escherichia coli]|uniref:hypothetical protein n=1 Tax=Escherichia coli TaxID=562 RepID=UPI0035278A9C